MNMAKILLTEFAFLKYHYKTLLLCKCYYLKIKVILYAYQCHFIHTIITSEKKSSREKKFTENLLNCSVGSKKKRYNIQFPIAILHFHEAQSGKKEKKSLENKIRLQVDQFFLQEEEEKDITIR